MSTKTMCIRIAEELAAELHAVAHAENVPDSEAIRAAIRQFVAARTAHPEFRARLQRRLEEDREALERMGELVAD